MFSTVEDYYHEIMAYSAINDVQGILSDDSVFALLKPPRLFSAHDFKLTYKGSLETKEYLLANWTDQQKLSTDRFPLLASLLGT